MIQAGLQALEEFGAGLSSVRFICGTQVHSGVAGWKGTLSPALGTDPSCLLPTASGAGLAQLIPSLGPGTTLSPRALC